MSIPLPERARALHIRLVALELLEDNVKEAGLLEGLRSDLEPEVDALSRALGQQRLLHDVGIEVDEPASLHSARIGAAVLLRKFSADKKASTLKKGVGWPNLIGLTKAASRDLGSAAAQRWAAYSQTIFTGDAPNVISERIALTAANKAALMDYSQRYQAYHSAATKLPVDDAAIENVRVLAEALTKAAKAFDFDVPVEVKRFLEAIQSGRASLDLLTDAVSAWLKTNKAFDTYRIVPRSYDGRR